VRAGGSRVLALAVGGLALLSSGVSCAGGDAARENVAGSEGPAPAAVSRAGARDDPYAGVVLQDTQGRTIPLGEYKGKVRLFDLWASWCGPCRMGIPHLNRLYDSYRDRGLVVIGVSIDARPEDVVEFTRAIPIRYPSGMMNPQIGALLGYPDAVPTTLLVDRTGHMRRRFLGYVYPALIEREVVKFLDTSAP